MKCTGDYYTKSAFRSKHIALPFLLLIIAQLGYMIWLFWHLLTYGNLLFSFSWMLKICILGYSVFVYLGYELSVAGFSHKTIETIHTTPFGRKSIITSNCLLLFCMSVLDTAIFFCGVTGLFVLSRCGYTAFLLHLYKSVLLYYFLPVIGGGMMGCALSSLFKTRRLPVYITAILLILLNTTFIEPILYLPFNLLDSERGTQFLYAIKDFFTVMPIGLATNYYLDSIYGLPMEPVRWMTNLFWAILPALLFVLFYDYTISRTRKTASIGICTTLVCVGVLVFCTTDYSMRMDERTDGFTTHDLLYYAIRRSANEENEAEYYADSYDMDLTIGKALNATVDIRLVNIPDNTTELCFTLYHGYKVLTVSDSSGNVLSFSHKGDSLVVYQDEQDIDNHLRFVYSGSAPKYYSNSQAVVLPAYFPYYPIVGIHNIWDYSTGGTKINVPDVRAHFIVNVDYGKDVFCNLPGDGASFEGDSYGVTLFSGLITQSENIVASPMNQYRITPDEVKRAGAEIERLASEYHIPYECSNLSELLVFQEPENYSYNSNTEESVFLYDHVITGASNAENLEKQLLISIVPSFGNSEELKTLFVRYLFLGDELNKYIERDSPETLLQNLRTFSGMSSREQFTNRKEVVFPALYYLLEASNRSNENRKKLQWYFAEDKTTTYPDFLIALLEEES